MVLIRRQDAIEAIREQLVKTAELEQELGWQNVSATAPIMQLFSAISAIPSADEVGEAKE